MYSKLFIVLTYLILLYADRPPKLDLSSNNTAFLCKPWSTDRLAGLLVLYTDQISDHTLLQRVYEIAAHVMEIDAVTQSV
jgi:hypothetical protein